MKILVALFFVIGLISSKGYSQEKIIYRFDRQVLDSLEKGFAHYSFYRDIPQDSLQLCVLIIEEGSEVHIFLQDIFEYRNFEAMKKLIHLSDRVLVMPDGKLLPIIFSTDLMSEIIIPAKIQNLPFWGYYVIVDRTKRQQVIKTGVSF